jgi:predicted RecB family nuclease
MAGSRAAFFATRATSGRGYYLLPAPDPDDLFLDLEGDALYEEGLEYLFGLVGPVEGAAKDTFRLSWAHSHAEEKAAFEVLMRLFVAHLVKYPDAHIYHYAAYEPAALKRLAMRYATMEAELDNLLYERRFVDLYRVARQAIRASTEGYSLKDLEQIYQGKRKGEVTTAADSIVEYERWRVTGDAAILEALSRYNKEDCLSTAQLRDWLESMRPAGVNYFDRGNVFQYWRTKLVFAQEHGA